jgi:hypothetical protein
MNDMATPDHGKIGNDSCQGSIVEYGNGAFTFPWCLSLSFLPSPSNGAVKLSFLPNLAFASPIDDAPKLDVTGLCDDVLAWDVDEMVVALREGLSWTDSLALPFSTGNVRYGAAVALWEGSFGEGGTGGNGLLSLFLSLRDSFIELLCSNSKVCEEFSISEADVDEKGWLEESEGEGEGVVSSADDDDNWACVMKGAGKGGCKNDIDPVDDIESPGDEFPCLAVLWRRRCCEWWLWVFCGSETWFARIALGCDDSAPVWLPCEFWWLSSTVEPLGVEAGSDADGGLSSAFWRAGGGGKAGTSTVGCFAFLSRAFKLLRLNQLPGLKSDSFWFFSFSFSPTLGK